MRKPLMALAVFALAEAVVAQNEPGPLAPPRNGPRAVDVGWSVVTGVTLHPRPGVVIENAGVEMRDGRVVRVLAPGETPVAGARVYDRTGTHVYAGFLDAYLEVDVPAPDRNAPGAHWSTKVTPQRSALQGTGADQATGTALR